MAFLIDLLNAGSPAEVTLAAGFDEALALWRSRTLVPERASFGPVRPGLMAGNLCSPGIPE
jgi:hypothetical protein